MRVNDPQLLLNIGSRFTGGLSTAGILEVIT